jgi:hypothetical protein
MAASMLSIPEPLTAHACFSGLTGDESWFDFSYEYECKGTLARDPSMTKPETLINAPKIFVSVIWGVDEPALAEIIPQVSVLAPSTYVKLQSPSESQCEDASPKTRPPMSITFRLNDAPSHIAKVTVAKISELRMNQKPGPPYSLDIAPSYLFIFGHSKHKLQRCSYNSTDELFSGIRDLMGNLENSLLHRVFDEWISHLHLIVEGGGADI